MTDIVNLLRQGTEHGNLTPVGEVCVEAANEIESLCEKLSKECKANLDLMAELTTERAISDKLEKALKDIRWQVEPDGDADVIAEASLTELAAMRKGETE